MLRRKLLPIIAVAGLFTLTGNALAQQSSGPESERPKPQVMLRMQLVITRLAGEAKIASLPYTFLVTPGLRTSLRMGAYTPITTSAAAAGEPPQYRNIGTSIDCSAAELPDGRYRMDLYVQHSSAFRGAGAGAANTAPVFGSFSVVLNPVLRDGQTIQTVASTDPVTGEVIRIDLTLNVVK
jgi:hypothetical protein